MSLGRKYILPWFACLLALLLAAPASATPDESPMLAELVKAGKLPPLKERLPEHPRVVEVPSIGQYGGPGRGGIFPPSGCGPGSGPTRDRIHAES